MQCILYVLIDGIYHCHKISNLPNHHGELIIWIPLTLSLSLYPSVSIVTLGNSQDSIQCRHRADKCKFLLINQQYVKVQKTSFGSLFLLISTSHSSFLESLRDRRSVAIQLPFRKVSFSRFVQNCT